MKLSRKFDQAMWIILAVALIAIFAIFVNSTTLKTFANSDQDPSLFDTKGARYVTFYDDGHKLSVKTDAKTVQEVIDRADIIINQGDIVEPSLDSEINADNFFINIYRARPVILRDGMTEKYLMTASYSPNTIAAEAGLTIYDGDTIEMVPHQNFLETGVANVYEITRNGGRTITIDEEIPFKEEIVKDPNLEPGKSEVRQLGEVGIKRTHYNVLYVDNKEVSRELVSEEIVREPVTRIVAEGMSQIEKNPLTASKGANIYTTVVNGRVVQRRETYYDLNMSGVMNNAARICGVANSYSVRADGAKIDADGYIIIAAHLGLYPRCSVVETSLGPGKVYDTGGFASGSPEQFDLATDWSNRDGI